MIKHIVLFRFTEDSTPEQHAGLLQELSGFPQRFPDMQRWTMGVNQSSRDDRFTNGFVIEFDDEQRLENYLRSDAHESFVRERFRPIVAERAIVSYEYAEDDRG